MAALLVVAGLVACAVAGWSHVRGTYEIISAQRQLSRQLAEEWRHPSDMDRRAGAPAFRLELPTLRRSWVAVHGIGPEELSRGPGYAGTAVGQLGNVVVAGHRNPALFWDLDELRPGDPIVVLTRDQRVVYRVARSQVLPTSAGWAMAANPDQPAAPPARQLLTLITCHPKLTTARRLVVRAELATGQ
ncbi:hypothetical protein Psuf_011370 [Phytohabitans suffuscus]|uniref:Class E sortase n=1 Tax=Phytohabitans suffuscus TaxID=624315 RepID=A0A6F8YCG4_9ACTN|nr:hypothetical protein Psuf_011370 [Phytohabitans suffuscus]